MVKTTWTLRATALASGVTAPLMALAQRQDLQDAQVLPEPETLALIAVAGAAVAVARWLRRK